MEATPAKEEAKAPIEEPEEEKFVEIEIEDRVLLV